MTLAETKWRLSKIKTGDGTEVVTARATTYVCSGCLKPYPQGVEIPDHPNDYSALCSGSRSDPIAYEDVHRITLKKI